MVIEYKDNKEKVMNQLCDNVGNNVDKKLVWKADLGNGMYRNPILYMDYSDPDVIRVGDTFYMTASSFNYVPGLPILTSKDLVNWELVNHAVKNIPYDTYETPAHAKGIWAPSIRYHNNKFWIFVGMPDEGIFMTNAEDPLGEWSPLTCVYEAKGFIDPCPFWDEDGKAYVIHAYAKSRIGFKSILGIFEMNWEGTRAISVDSFIFDGNETQPTIEGPKVYKRDGEYYIFAPAGSVKTGWQTVLKSKNIYGPYEEKIVMHQGNSRINGPHQGGLVDTMNGEEWFIHFQDKGVYGRIVHLQPVIWKNGWPIIGVDNENIGIGEPVEVYRKPDGLDLSICEPDTSDEFDKNVLGLQWQWLGNLKEDFYSLDKKEGSLILYALNTSKKDKALLWNSSNVLSQKFPCPSFESRLLMDYSQLVEGDRAGIIVIGGEYQGLYVEKVADKYRLSYLESSGDNFDKVETVRIIKDLEDDTRTIELGMTFSSHGYSRVMYKVEEEWIRLDNEFSPLGAVWVGAKVGMFAVNDNQGEEIGAASFEYFHLEATEE